ncbi:MAG: threonine/serine exporter family protein [Acidibacillus sp.]|uniref:Threonine/Serine exporter ThrE domain-containing protein n=1 Tax=Sulfoacidibacillus ferrooxidans TaxID=2005001 RepID=A0A9X1V7H1_9BACL|nr:threonine/serine exporter family protein [Sulfoacidibacillus ferrooxidans]MCI0182597.1 hypothetical protein [Sulfoacidibacillus ferrooxidans]MCY0894131.1 threonine/serine exporter family protein [Acidibacillus sp.]
MDVLLSIVATIAFSILYQIPRKAIIPVGILGMVAELFMIGAQKEHVGEVAASFAASLTISLLSEGFARTLRMPVTIFAVPGIIVLVPGMNAYQTMKDFVTHHYISGIAMGTETALIAGALASGLVMVGVLARSVWRPRNHVH